MEERFILLVYPLAIILGYRWPKRIENCMILWRNLYGCDHIMTALPRN